MSEVVLAKVLAADLEKTEFIVTNNYIMIINWTAKIIQQHALGVTGMTD